MTGNDLNIKKLLRKKMQEKRLADVFTPEKRSWVMSRIRSKNTKIDLRMKRILSAAGLSYRMYPKMYGNPDFILRKKRIAMFCDGDFWHGYRYHEKKKPAQKFWRDKIEGNMKRDRRIAGKLRRDGWSVLRFWEHDIEKRPELCRKKITMAVKRSSSRSDHHVQCSRLALEFEF